LIMRLRTLIMRLRTLIMRPCVCPRPYGRASSTR
jgi:hypothetical protein